MNRRALAVAAAATLVVPYTLAQHSRQPRRIGLLAIGNATGGASNGQRLLAGLRDQGFVKAATSWSMSARPAAEPKDLHRFPDNSRLSCRR